MLRPRGKLTWRGRGFGGSEGKGNNDGKLDCALLSATETFKGVRALDGARI